MKILMPIFFFLTPIILTLFGGYPDIFLTTYCISFFLVHCIAFVPLFFLLLASLSPLYLSLHLINIKRRLKYSSFHLDYTNIPV